MKYLNFTSKRQEFIIKNKRGNHLSGLRLIMFASHDLPDALRFLPYYSDKSSRISGCFCLFFASFSPFIKDFNDLMEFTDFTYERAIDKIYLGIPITARI